MKIRTNNDPSARYDVWQYGSFSFRKEMVFSTVSQLEKVVKNLDRLKTEKFYNIVVPDFTYEVVDHILTIDMDYIKGQMIQSIHHYNIIYDELVERDSDYSWTDYTPENYIVHNDRIYVIDLDSYGYIKYEDRKRKWENSFGIFAPIIRSYKGKHQMKVNLSCHNLEYLKLKKLLKFVFNAEVTRSISPFFARIDDLEFYNLKDTMNYLKELHEEMQSNMNLNTPRHQDRKDLLRKLR